MRGRGTRLLTTDLSWLAALSLPLAEYQWPLYGVEYVVSKHILIHEQLSRKRKTCGAAARVASRMTVSANRSPLSAATAEPPPTPSLHPGIGHILNSL